MALHLEEISLAVAPGAHAILLLDQAGWHVSKRLSIPDNITLLPLPPKSPELNPVENIWQFMHDNWPSNRGFKFYDDILDHCCFAWNNLIDMRWKIMSIGTRDWVYRYKYRKRIWASLPSSLRIAWKGVLKPRYFLGVRLAVMTILDFRVGQAINVDVTRQPAPQAAIGVFDSALLPRGISIAEPGGHGAHA
jgi:transposase